MILLGIYNQIIPYITDEKVSYLEAIYSKVYSLSELDKHRITLIGKFFRSQIDLPFIKEHFDTITITTDNNQTIILNTQEFMDQYAEQHQKLE